MVMCSLHRFAGFSSALTPDVRALTLASGGFVYVCLGRLLFWQVAALKALILACFRLFFKDRLRFSKGWKFGESEDEGIAVVPVPVGSGESTVFAPAFFFGRKTWKFS
ncbi:hypothetical protein Bca4012_053229 [Brassica carinata]